MSDIDDELDSETLSREIPIHYYGNEDVVALFADQVVVANVGGLFTIYFYQMQVPPIIFESDIAKLKKIQGIQAKCVSRVVLTPILMEQFLRAIETNLGRYKKSLEQQPDK